jgi:hypothetical protein
MGDGTSGAIPSIMKTILRFLLARSSYRARLARAAS